MNTEIRIFKNIQFGEIRTTLSENGDPLICLIDVARSLGYRRPADAVTEHCKGVGILPTPTNKGLQQIKFGRESEVYRLVIKSKLREAEKFQDWVFEEILPSLRKTGAYMTDMTLEKVISDPAFMIGLTELQKKKESKKIAEAE